MYTVSKGPSKIVAKTRRGLTQNLERLDSRKDYNRKSSDSENGEIVIMPKPIFHSNGKKTVHQRIQHNVITPQHEEMIRYISETWIQTASGDSEPSTPTSTIDKLSSRKFKTRVRYAQSSRINTLNDFETSMARSNRNEMSAAGSGSSSPAPSLYYQDAPSPVLDNFTPFDLETWWGKRLYINITNSI